MATDFTVDPDEQIVAEFPRHWISIFPVIASTVILLGALVVLTYYIGRYPDSFTPYVPLNVLSLVMLVIGALAILILLVVYAAFRQNKVVLTTVRLEEATQYGMFARNISRLGLTEVEDVTSRQHGLFADILQYGDVVVQTAGEQEHFVFHQVGHPDEIAKQILQACTACKNKASVSTAPTD